MCGIVGIYTKDGLDHIKVTPEVLSHRGPDASGVWNSDDNKVTFGHTRLSVIDLSEAANQPFHSSDGRYVVVYNGELYNHLEIRKKIHVPEVTNQVVASSAGLSHEPETVNIFRTKSDTESLLAAYQQWGPACLDRFNGMFAFAIYDKRDQALFLARDHMGIKPLFWYKDDDTFAFASEIKALTTIPAIKSKLTINSRAISRFLHLGYIPAPDTIYTEIKKFPQGHYAIIDKTLDVTFRKWWSAEEQIEPQIFEDELKAMDKLQELVEDAVHKRLLADVSVGSFLSGGIDSSLVSAVAQRFSDKPFKTFNIGFEDQKFDESVYARKVAAVIGSDHHEYRLTEQEAMARLLDILPTYDEPFADSSAIPMMLISELAAKEVKVVLTGDGGDELFHGYGMYAWASRLGSVEKRFIARSLSYPLRKFGNSRWKRIGRLMNVDGRKVRSHIFSQEQHLFDQRELQQLLTSFSIDQANGYEDPEVKRNLNPAEKQALFDLTCYLPDDLLVKVDRATMKYGLEARVPLLDKQIISFALNVDPSLKKYNKYLLKQVLYKYLPAHLFERPKWGFGVPLGKWLKRDLKYLVDDYLNKEKIEASGFVNYQMVSEYLNRYKKGEDYIYNRLWSLIILHMWSDNV